MIRILAALLTGVLFVLPLLTTPVLLVAAIGLGAACLATVGIVARWRWAVTAAACVFLVEYAAALSVTAASLDFVRAAGFGLALLLLLHAQDFARRVGRTAVDRAVPLAHLRRWLGIGASALAATVFTLIMTGLLGATLPLVAAPLAAALGALGSLLALAAMVRHAARKGSWR